MVCVFATRLSKKFWVAERSKCQVPHIRKFFVFLYFPGKKQKFFFVVDDIYIVENVVVEK
jgi:hypothetical protein